MAWLQTAQTGVARFFPSPLPPRAPFPTTHIACLVPHYHGFSPPFLEPIFSFFPLSPALLTEDDQISSSPSPGLHLHPAPPAPSPPCQREGRRCSLPEVGVGQRETSASRSFIRVFIPPWAVHVGTANLREAQIRNTRVIHHRLGYRPTGCGPSSLPTTAGSLCTQTDTALTGSDGCANLERRNAARLRSCNQETSD